MIETVLILGTKGICMPKVKGDEMAQCDSCDVWYHQQCMDIPSEVFGDSNVPWVCKNCIKF